MKSIPSGSIESPIGEGGDGGLVVVVYILRSLVSSATNETSDLNLWTCWPREMIRYSRKRFRKVDNENNVLVLDWRFDGERGRGL